jgi:hypothetical protein
MRVTLLGMERRTLPTVFEAPPGADRPEYSAFYVRPHPGSSAVAIPLFGRDGVTAVWDSETGKLLWDLGPASDLGWSPDGSDAYVLVNKFGPGPRGGIGHRLVRYSWPGREPREELLFSVPSGGADALVVSPAGGLAAVVAMEGPEWYYEVLGLRPSLSQLGVGLRIDDDLGDGPVFSPDERYLVTVGSPGYVWWARPGEERDEEEWRLPSEGGTYELGWVYVHDLAEDRKTKHPLVVDLPAGWQPVPRDDEPDGRGWMVVWGPRFSGERTFRLWLPDGRPLDLDLPLPETVEVPILRTTWQGPGRHAGPGVATDGGRDPGFP